MTSRQWVWLLIGVVAVALWPLFMGRFYAIGDMRDVFIPIEHFYHQELAAGRLPAWWPEAAWGFPVIAAAQIGFFYPPLLILRWLPLSMYLPIVFGLHLIWLASGMWLFLRKLSFSSQAAYVGAISLALSQFVWQHFTHLNVLLTLTWLPWQFLAAHYFTQSPSLKQKYFYWLTVTIAMPFLAGQLQIPLLMAIVTSVYILIVFYRQTKQLSRPLFIIGLLALCTFGLAAVQLLPTYELAHYSSRGGAGSYNLTQANQHSFPLYHLQTAIWPRFFGSDNTYWGKRLEIEYGFFIGTIPLLLALWASYRQYKKYRWWVWLAIVSFLLALGNLSPFRLLKIEPSLWIFSAPARWLLFTTFAGGVLAAAGFDQLKNYSGSFQKLVRVVTVLLILLVLSSNMVIFNLNRLVPLAAHAAHLDGDYYSQKLQSLVHSIQTSSVSLASPYTWLPLLVLGISWFTLRTKNTRLLLTTITLELLVIALSTTPTLPWSTILNTPSSVATLPLSVRDHSARLLAIRPAGGDTGAWLTNPETRVDMAGREQQRQLLVPLVHTQFGILGAEWPASLDIQGQSQVLDSIKNNQDGQLNLLQAAAFNIGAITQLNNAGAVTVTPVIATPRATYVAATNIPATYTQLNPQHIVVTGQAPTAGTVTIRDTWFPGWQATVNGVPTPINHWQTIFRGIPVPAGNFTIDMQYYPHLLDTGLIISISTMIAIVLCLWWSTKRGISSPNHLTDV